jgi:hypothetical protein
MNAFCKRELQKEKTDIKVEFRADSPRVYREDGRISLIQNQEKDHLNLVNYLLTIF